ncbi:MAG: cytochrome c oxidase subunit II [Haloarculaceae archaeon]
MEIHRFEKIWLVVSLVLIVGFIATVAYGAVGAGVAMVDDSGGTINPANVGPGGAQTPFDDPGIRKVGENEYVVYVRAQQFRFVPGTQNPITVPADANVTFRVTSADVTHGFNVVGTNVNTMVIPGEISEMTVRFDEPGTYGLVCNEYCGVGHHTMAGTVRVVPQSQFNVSEVNN